MFHLSLLFPHGHFETNPDITFLSTFLPYLPVLKAQDMRHSAHASRSLATWPDQMQTHTGRLVAETTKNPIGTEWSHHNLDIPRNNVGHLEKVYSNVRQKTWSSTGRRHALDRRQRDDLEYIYVSDYESRGTSWTRLSRELSYHQEHRLPKGQTVVPYFTETEHESKWRNSCDICNWLDYNSMDENYFIMW